MDRSLLELTQSILSDMESEEVNSLGDTVEAQQVAGIIKSVYFEIIVPRYIPEHHQLVTLTALADSTKPTHFTFSGGDNKSVSQVRLIKYDKDTTGTLPSFQRVYYKDPVDFLDNSVYNTSGVLAVEDPNSGTPLYIRTDRMPSYYTTFDDEFIVMDSYDSSVEATLQESKTQAMARVLPVWTTSDDFVPDLDDEFRPYLLAEARDRCFDLMKSGSVKDE